MIATIPLATGNMLNCFISARRMLTIIWLCTFVLLVYSCSCVDFWTILNVNKSSSQKTEKVVGIKCSFARNLMQ